MFVCIEMMMAFHKKKTTRLICSTSGHTHLDPKQQTKDVVWSGVGGARKSAGRRLQMFFWQLIQKANFCSQHQRGSSQIRVFCTSRPKEHPISIVSFSTTMKNHLSLMNNREILLTSPFWQFIVLSAFYPFLYKNLFSSFGYLLPYPIYCFKKVFSPI